jgi:cyclopropane fatty-acyl-phospholipid synthase-like methyltransferase
VLSHPLVYDVSQRLLGGHRARRTLAREFLHVTPGQRVLDVGCGPGSMLACLPRRISFEYVGYDVSPYYIRHAARRFGRRGRFVCGAVDEDIAEREDSFDWVLAMGLLHHLDDADGRELFAIAGSKLVPGGSFVTLDGVYTDRQSRVARYILSRDRGQHMRTASEYLGLARSAFARVEYSVRDGMFRVPYTALIMTCRK